ncbi:sugar-binding protein [Teredinibacter haidensis]|uniref:sugar-binding protein n=1 Tax=Teredinibacter haidensis TaxID=2731755 RepID=UPI00094900A7|nr:sugar-binding protein [Teredinibacter haidensis]
MKKVVFWVFITCSLSMVVSVNAADTVENKSYYRAPFTAQAPVIDGVADESFWQKAEWKHVNHVLIGGALSEEDFSGRMKIVWDNSRLYLLAEIVDDVMSDVYADPLTHFWDDEALEIFIDEDASGGDHQFNHSAFAYHIALDNQVVDSGPDKAPHLYNDHLQSQWKRYGGKTVWEVAIKVFDDSFVDGDKTAKPVRLKAGKKLGFMLAYCDNDGGKSREHFVGSEDIVAVNGDRNRGWIDANVFGVVELVR